MARIQFSSLISSIKGKIGTTVFSENTGGNYVRTSIGSNLRSKGALNRMNSLLPAVARGWAQLDLAEADAWDDATINFPTTNIFGNTRYPTGYELYCKLNGTLSAYNQPLINTPPSVARFPGIEFTGQPVNTKTQFLPQKMFPFYDGTNLSIQQSISFDDYTFSNFMLDGYYFGARFQYDPIGTLSNSTITNQTLIAYTDGGSNSIKLLIEDCTDTRVNMELKISTSTYVGTLSFTMELSLFNLGCHIGIRTHLATPSLCEIYINGSVIVPTFAETGTFSNPDTNFYYVIGSQDNAGFLPLMVSDFRASVQSPLPVDMPDISNGYFPQDMEFRFDLVSYSGTSFINAGTLGALVSGTVQNELSTPVMTKNVQTLLIPDMFIDITGTPDSAFYLQLYSTPWQSPGRDIQTSRTRLFYSAPYTTSGVINVTNAFRQKFGIYQLGTSNQIEMRLVDMTSGQVTIKTHQHPHGRKAKFKYVIVLPGKPI